MKKKIPLLAALAAILTLLIIPQTACTENLSGEPVTKENYYFDTICRISIYDMEDMSKENAVKAIDGAFSLCGEYENILSKTIETSDIARINSAGGEAVSIDPATLEVLNKGIHYGDLSGGAFDITIGRLTALWDFHAEEPKLPDETAVREAQKTVNYQNLRIEGSTACLLDPQASLDLGGLGKGYVGDRVQEYLRDEWGVTSCIISLGGNIICLGDKGGSKFKVGIETPFTDMQEIVGITPVSDGTVVTSGIYERFFEEDGKIYHHILDPKTGYPAESDVLGVTITAPSGCSCDADALSTISLLLGTENGLALIESLEGYEALFIGKDGEISKTSGMEFEEK